MAASAPWILRCSYIANTSHRMVQVDRLKLHVGVYINFTEFDNKIQIFWLAEDR
jgi:hypothetical protein